MNTKKIRLPAFIYPHYGFVKETGFRYIYGGIFVHGNNDENMQFVAER